MSSARDTVTAAYRMIGGIDINDLEPSPAEMERGLEWLTKLLDSWVADGLNLATQVLAGTLISGEATVTDLASTALLAPGMNASGTGIPAAARILTIDSLTQVTLDADATASGSAVSVTFAALPFQPRYQLGVEALLALQLAPLIRMEPPAMAVLNASKGWDMLVGNFLRVPAASYDPALTNTSARRVGFFGG